MGRWRGGPTGAPVMAVWCRRRPDDGRTSLFRTPSPSSSITQLAISGGYRRVSRPSLSKKAPSLAAGRSIDPGPAEPEQLLMPQHPVHASAPARTTASRSCPSIPLTHAPVPSLAQPSHPPPSPGWDKGRGRESRPHPPLFWPCTVSRHPQTPPRLRVLPPQVRGWWRQRRMPHRWHGLPDAPAAAARCSAAHSPGCAPPAGGWPRRPHRRGGCAL